MSQRSHPVGYRPQENFEPSPARSGSGCAPLFQVLVLLSLFGGFGYFFLYDRGKGEEMIAWVDSKIRSKVESVSTPRTAVLDSGQVIEGDFETVTIGQHLAAGDIEAAMAVAIEKDPEALRRLLDEEGVDPDLRLSYGSPDNWSHPLEKAVRQGSWETFQILLEAGADVNGAGSGGETALRWAAFKGLLEIVDELLARGADPDQLAIPADDETPEARWEKAHVGATPLEAAASRGHREVVIRLLAAGAEPRYALHAAASAGSVELIDFLLERGADPHRLEASGDGPLRYSTMSGHVEATQRLLAAGARPREQALRQTAQNGYDDILRAMAKAGIRFDGSPIYWGPLYAAAYAGQGSTVALLLELGASTGAAEGYDRPIDAAREQGHNEIVALLESR